MVAQTIFKTIKENGLVNIQIILFARYVNFEKPPVIIQEPYSAQVLIEVVGSKQNHISRTIFMDIDGCLAEPEMTEMKGEHKNVGILKM